MCWGLYVAGSSSANGGFSTPWAQEGVLLAFVPRKGRIESTVYVSGRSLARRGTPLTLQVNEIIPGEKFQTLRGKIMIMVMMI